MTRQAAVSMLSGRAYESMTTTGEQRLAPSPQSLRSKQGEGPSFSALALFTRLRGRRVLRTSP